MDAKELAKLHGQTWLDLLDDARGWAGSKDPEEAASYRGHVDIEKKALQDLLTEMNPPEGIPALDEETNRLLQSGRVVQAYERQIVQQVLRDLFAAGYKVEISVTNDDSEYLITSEFEEAFKNLMASDVERVYVRGAAGQRNGWVFFVYGNDGHDVISDYTTNLEDVLKKSHALAESFE